MRRYYRHDYSVSWIDVAGIEHHWKHIEDSYLRNIKNKLQRSGDIFPPKAMYYCKMEIERRELAKGPAVRMEHQPININCRSSLNNDFVDAMRYATTQREFNTTGFDMASPTNHYSKKENHMYNQNECAERPVQIVVRIKDEQLTEYYLKKVFVPQVQLAGKVIAIHANSTSGQKQLTVKLEKNCVTVDAHEVEIVKQIAVYAYQHRNGDVNYSSKVLAPSVMKKQGVKKIESATKYFDA